MARASGGAGGTGERVAREPLTGRVARSGSRHERSGPVGERATPTQGVGAPDREAGQDPRCHYNVIRARLATLRVVAQASARR